MTTPAAEPTAQEQYMLSAKGGRVDAGAHERALVRQGVAQPTYVELVAALVKYGPDGILESALHLTDDEFVKLAALTHDAPKRKAKRGRCS